MGHRHVFVVSLALLLVVAATHAAGGHATQVAAAATTAAAIVQQGTDHAGGVVDVGSMTRRSMIGSSPPNCEGMCGWWCVGRSCEAVLVPIEPPKKQDKKKPSRRHGIGRGGGDDDGSRAASPAAAVQKQRRPSSVYDDGDHAEYKPIAWRCECVGDT